MSAISTVAKKSFQWMTNVGVDAADVEWLEGMEGSIELHMPGNCDRVRLIYQSAMSGILSSDKPELHLLHTLN